MGMVKKSVSITEQQDQWLKSQIESGDYGNESEIVRDLIRDRVSRDAEIEAVRAALIEGENSGISDVTPQDIRARVRKRLVANGQL